MMRKKGLSLFLAVLMLLSMLAGFSLPAGAAVADLQAILEMHQEYDATLFEAEVQAQMLTFRAALEERIEAYLDEDIAGRKALISQSQAESEALLAAMNGGLRADVTARLVYIDGERVDMSPKEYDLFFYMLSNRNIALSREKLLCEVWGYDFYGDARTLDTHIKLLRKSLGKYADYIVTLRGVGYRFEDHR